jgi:hypothetical protein
MTTKPTTTTTTTGMREPASGTSMRIVPPDDRPEIKIGVDIDRMVRQATSALVQDPDTYVRGGALVHVARAEDSKRDHALPEGSPVIRTMTRSTLRSRLSRCARWVRYKDKEWQDTTPAENATSAALDEGAWRDVPQLVGVTETPMLRADGSILQAPGYDEATGYLYVPSERYPAIPDEPTQADAAEALAQLALVFASGPAGFPFESPAAQMVPVAALCTLLARAAIDGSVPCVVIDASTKGSGKSLLTDTIAIIANGRAAARTTYPPEPDELRKVLDGYALQGSSFIGIDNVDHALGGSALDAFLTAHDTVDVRELGRTGQRSVPWRAVIFATGNNVTYAGDTIRRVIRARLEPECEKPEDRTDFAIDDLRVHARRARPRLVVAALTILRAFVVAGRPGADDKRWGSFEAWARLIPPAIRHAGGACVLDARVLDSAENDPQTAALQTILTDLPRLVSAAGASLRARDILHALYSRDEHDQAPDGFDDLRDAIECVARTPAGKTPGARQIGESFRRMRGRWIAGKKLGSEIDQHSKVVRWNVVTRVEQPK